MDWVPEVFITFKVLVLCIGMFYAIKWHYDQGKKANGKEKQRAVLRAGVIVVTVFLVLLAAVLLLAYGLGTTLGLDLGF